MKSRTLVLPNLFTKCVYSVMGKGNPVMLIHGFCESSAVWREQASLLSQDFLVISVDIPGYGESEPFSDEQFSTERVSEVLFAVADAENITHFSIVGHSLGGYIAAAMLEQNPERIERVVMFHSTSRSDNPEKRKNRDKTVRIVSQNRQLFFREMIKNLFNSKRLHLFSEQMENLYQQAESIKTQSIVAALIGMRDRKDRFEVLSQSDTRIFYFIGREDNLLPAEALIAEAQDLGAEYFVSENSGHMGFFEASEETAQCLKSFLGIRQ